MVGVRLLCKLSSPLRLKPAVTLVPAAPGQALPLDLLQEGVIADFAQIDKALHLKPCIG